MGFSSIYAVNYSECLSAVLWAWVCVFQELCYWLCEDLYCCGNQCVPLRHVALLLHEQRAEETLAWTLHHCSLISSTLNKWSSPLTLNRSSILSKWTDNTRQSADVEFMKYLGLQTWHFKASADLITLLSPETNDVIVCNILIHSKYVIMKDLRRNIKV